MLVLIVGLFINLASGTKVHAANISKPMPINEIFPDPNLAKAVKYCLKKNSVTDIVSQQELDKVESFNTFGLSYKENIKRLDGIQYFTN